MDRVCPFLAVAVDRRSVVDGFDPDHRCHAEAPALELDRARQTSLCLTEAHRECEIYLGALKRHAATIAAPPPAPDALIARTRLVIEPPAARRPPVTGPGSAARRWALGGALAAIGVAAVATGAAGALGGLADAPDPGMASPSLSDAATPRPTATQLPVTAPTVGTGAPAPTTAATAGTASTAGPTAEGRTYVVRAGDTLDGIAGRFGTTVRALMDANGLASADLINVGQVLVIP